MSDDTDAEAARPMLASQLIDDQDEWNELFAYARTGTGSGRRLRTSVKSVDDALEGGLECGLLVGVHSEAGSGGSELCRRWLVDSLLAHDGAAAAIIDTTGHFDLLRVYHLLSHGIQSSPHGARMTPETLQNATASVLHRLKIMRVFDFVGVKEAVCEIREGLENKGGSEAHPPTSDTTSTTIVHERERRLHRTREPVVSKRKFVADSEDEGDDDDDDEDEEEEEEQEEMLFDSEHSLAQSKSAQERTDDQDKGNHNNNSNNNNNTTTTTTSLKFILIDNLSQVLHAMLKKDYVQTNASASTLLHQLALLTHTHALHTIIANPAVSPTRQALPVPTHSAMPYRGRQQQYQQYHHQQAPPPSPSVFASTAVVPSSLGLLVPYLDVQLLVARVPRRERDAAAAALYHYHCPLGDEQDGKDGKDGRDGRDAARKKKRVNMLSVLEVVGDRWGGRVGSWGAFAGGETGIENHVW